MIDLNELHPIELDNLIRIGNKYDGGYLVSKRQINNTQILLTFGLRYDWLFEEDFSKRKNIEIFSYDFSTYELLNKSIMSLISRLFCSILASIYHLIRLKPNI